MNLYETIQKIQFKESIGVNEFLDLTGFSKGMYYDIKKGKKTELKPNQLKKLVTTFPKCDFILSPDKSETSKKEKTELIRLKESAELVAMHFEEAKKVSKLFDLTVQNDNKDYLIKKLAEHGVNVVE